MGVRTRWGAFGPRWRGPHRATRRRRGKAELLQQHERQIGDREVELAQSLCQPGASIDVLQAYDSHEPELEPDPPQAIMRSIAQSRASLRARLHELTDRLKQRGFDATGHFQRGELCLELMLRLETRVNDMVIVGSGPAGHGIPLGDPAHQALASGLVPVAVGPDV